MSLVTNRTAIILNQHNIPFGGDSLLTSSMMAWVASRSKFDKHSKGKGTQTMEHQRMLMMKGNRQVAIYSLSKELNTACAVIKGSK